MDAAFFILRDHPLNEERQQEGLRPANCLWLWGQGRAALGSPCRNGMESLVLSWHPAMFIAGLDCVLGWRRSNGPSMTEMGQSR